MIRLGVFDSGIGGEAIAKSLQETFPRADIIIVNDHKNVPYGKKPAALIRYLTDNAIQPLLNSSCDIIILACNTASSYALNYLRKKYPNQKFIGLEPMIKPAAKITQSGVIAVLATSATLKSRNYTRLTRKYASNLKIIAPDCSKWASMIENHKIDKSAIQKNINIIKTSGADVIILGCTHYSWIKQMIATMAGPNIKILEPSEAIGRRVSSMLNLS